MARKRHYINNKDMFAALCDFLNKCSEAEDNNKQIPRIPEYLGQAFWLLCERIGTRPNFSGYSYLDEMKGDGIENCFHGNTKFLTLEYGPIELKSVVGKTVTVKTRDGSWKSAKVKCYGTQKIYEYGIGSQAIPIDKVTYKVLATENHRWPVVARLNNRGLRDFKSEVITDLREGDVIDIVSEKINKDSEAIIHGLIFGDGTGHKSVAYNETAVVQQGNKYAFIRVCKQDSSKDEIMSILETAGYEPQYRPHANGDPIYWLGRKALIKDLPFTNDPEYISGFIYGWWLADGLKSAKDKRIVISTSNEMAAKWLEEYCAYAGMFHISTRVTNRCEGDGSYANGKPLYTVTMSKEGQYSPTVRYKKYVGIDEVYCVEEPVTNTFTLSNGLLTGNCVMQVRSFNPQKSQNPFAYFSTIIHNAYVRRIKKEKRQHLIKIKNLDNMSIDDEIAGIQTQKSSYNEVTDAYVKDFESKNKKPKPKKKPKVLKAKETENRFVAIIESIEDE